MPSNEEIRRIRRLIAQISTRLDALTAEEREHVEQAVTVVRRRRTSCLRLVARSQQLEARLSELLGEQAWRESELGAPEDIDQLKQRIVFLEQQAVDLRLQLDERDQELAAARRRARAANRELMTQLNASRETG